MPQKSTLSRLDSESKIPCEPRQRTKSHTLICFNDKRAAPVEKRLHSHCVWPAESLMIMRWIAAMSATGGAVIPRRAQDQAAEIQALVGRILEREDIGLHVAERGLRLLDRAVSEGIDDPFLEIHLTRMDGDDLFALRVGELVVRESEHVHLHARRDQRDHRFLVLRNPRRGVQGD